MASRFWVGGTGTWDASNTTHWAATSAGAGGASVPGSGDTVTFDVNSGGGTVTVNTNVDVVSITCGAHTGTLDFSANNNTVTLQTFSGSGSATRTFNMGSGQWTLTGTGNVWLMNTITGLTFTSSAAIAFSATTGSRAFNSGALTYPSLTVAAPTAGALFSTSGSFTFTALTIATAAAYPAIWSLSVGDVMTVGTLTWSGSSTSARSMIRNTGVAASTISISSGTVTLDWFALLNITFAGGATFAATNSYNIGGNSGITITLPSAGGTSRARAAAGF